MGVEKRFAEMQCRSSFVTGFGRVGSIKVRFFHPFCRLRLRFADCAVTQELAAWPAAPLDPRELQQMEGVSIALYFSSTIVLLDC